MDNIIEVKQLPIIEEHLKSLKSAIEKKTSTALKMVCTEDTVKEIKKIRASLTKEFTELETRRKEVKAQLETPYQEFYKVYQDCVSTPFKQADAELKRKVNDVENELKSTKRNKLIDYANELKAAYALDWLNIERILPNVTLSASLTSLKQTVADKLDGINSDCQCISAIGESSLAVLVEYKKSLNLSQAQLIVSEREKEVQKAKSDAEIAKRCHFNPRSPRGERPNKIFIFPFFKVNFNPRSPRGERQSFCCMFSFRLFISIHALREESDKES